MCCLCWLQQMIMDYNKHTNSQQLEGLHTKIILLLFQRRPGMGVKRHKTTTMKESYKIKTGTVDSNIWKYKLNSLVTASLCWPPKQLEKWNPSFRTRCWNGILLAYSCWRDYYISVTRWAHGGHTFSAAAFARCTKCGSWQLRTHFSKGPVASGSIKKKVKCIIVGVIDIKWQREIIRTNK